MCLCWCDDATWLFGYCACVASRPIMIVGFLAICLSVCLSAWPEFLYLWVSLCGLPSETEITAQSTYYSTAAASLAISREPGLSPFILSLKLSLRLALWHCLGGADFGQVKTQTASVVHFRSHRCWAPMDRLSAGSIPHYTVSWPSEQFAFLRFSRLT